MSDDNSGVWVAYYLDYSEMVPFDSEVEARRYAVAHSMHVDFVAFGTGIREVVNQRWGPEKTVPAERVRGILG